ncbi:MAG: diacylglyceryl transferase [Proteobacteria bacterium]|nr:diacylglyceryl transferase [Pseudomonadota bacterium]
MKKLKEKWGIESNAQMTIIFIVFAITGSCSVKFSDPLLLMMGLTQDSTHIVVYWIVNILFTFFLYQILLISFGTLFGQFSFFWKFERKMLSRLGISVFEDKVVQTENSE